MKLKAEQILWCILAIVILVGCSLAFKEHKKVTRQSSIDFKYDIITLEKRQFIAYHDQSGNFHLVGPVDK